MSCPAYFLTTPRPHGREGGEHSEPVRGVGRPMIVKNYAGHHTLGVYGRPRALIEAVCEIRRSDGQHKIGDLLSGEIPAQFVEI